MKIKFAFFLLLFALFFSSNCTKEQVDPDLSFEIKSQSTGYEYKIDVVYFNGNSSDKVLFVLDPSSMLPLVQKSLKDINYHGEITLVGIDFKGENKRNRDYTPTENGEETGEAVLFMVFIQEDLDSELKTRGVINSGSEKGLIGHSLSGLATIYAFFKHNYYFENYIIGSPALWWDSYSIFELEKVLRGAQFSSKIFMGVGNQEDMGMQNAFEALSEIFREHYQDLNLKTHLSNGSHMGSRSETINEGLKHVLQ